MEDYNVEDRLITKDDWEEWLNKKGQKETGEEKVEWHPYPQEKPSNGIKLAKVKNTLTDKVDVRRYLAVRGRFYSEDYTHVIAWAELSESYKEQKNDQSRTNQST